MRKLSNTATLILSVFFLASSLPTYAADQAVPPGECNSRQTARDTIRDQLLQFRSSDLGQSLEARAAAGEITLVFGDPVSVNAALDHADFGKSRDLAFARSFLDTQSKFILLQNRRIQTETLSESFDQVPSQEEMSFKDGETDGKLWRLGEKLFRLTEAKLDAALESEGVPRDELAGANPKKKVDLYREKLTRKTAQRAAERVAGLLPIMNFEASDCEGRAAVATVAVFSQKTLDFTRAFVNGKAFIPNADAKAEKSVNQQILEEMSGDEIVDLWGLRKVHDQAGYPALVSYGQWSYLKRDGASRANERREVSALQHAENNALQQIALFLNGTASVVISTEVDEFVNAFVELEKTRDGVIESTQEIEEIVERRLTNMSARANVTLHGVSSPLTWVKPYPNDASNVQLVGAVVYWTPLTEDAVNRAVGRSSQRAAGSGEGQAAPDSPKNMESGKRESKVKNSARDF